MTPMVAPYPFILGYMAQTLAQRFKQARLDLNQTQEAIAIAAQTTRATVQRIENGIRVPGRDLLPRLAAALGISVAEAWKLWTAEGSDEAEITYVADPDLALIIDSYEGGTPRDKRLLKALAEQIRQIEREHTIGSRPEDADTEDGGPSEADAQAHHGEEPKE